MDTEAINSPARAVREAERSGNVLRDHAFHANHQLQRINEPSTLIRVESRDSASMQSACRATVNQIYRRRHENTSAFGMSKRCNHVVIMMSAQSKESRFGGSKRLRAHRECLLVGPRLAQEINVHVGSADS